MVAQIKSQHFSAKELSCKCGCGFLPTIELIVKLHDIREAYGKPIFLTSAARCSTYNRKIGGARLSAHVEGKAADLARTPELQAFIEANMDRFNIWGEKLEFTPTWIHIQTRPVTSGRWFIP